MLEGQHTEVTAGTTLGCTCCTHITHKQHAASAAAYISASCKTHTCTAGRKRPIYGVHYAENRTYLLAIATRAPGAGTAVAATLHDDGCVFGVSDTKTR